MGLLAEEKALVRVKEVDEIPMEVGTAPHVGQKVRLPRQHTLQLKKSIHSLLQIWRVSVE